MIFCIFGFFKCRKNFKLHRKQNCKLQAENGIIKTKNQMR